MKLNRKNIEETKRLLRIAGADISAHCQSEIRDFVEYSKNTKQAAKELLNYWRD